MITTLFENKSIAFLGFGREGQSTYKLFRRIFPQKIFTIIDENENVSSAESLRNDPNLRFIIGKDCMKAIDEFDVAIKSPGIPSNTLPGELKQVHITSQTDIFLHCFGQQVIGITGTKGKSTTASLVSHILKNARHHALLVGNIGIPPFDCIDDIKPDSTVVMELSSHQLEYLGNSPHIAVLLNIFQEHLDHYHSYSDYQKAKFNIATYQKAYDYFIYNIDNDIINQLIDNSDTLKSKLLPFSLNPESVAAIHLNSGCIELQTEDEEVSLYNSNSGQLLKGYHNLYNIMAAAAACFLSGISIEDIDSGIKSFSGLEHRIEFVGNFDGIIWYNDSIATIPEATIEAVKTLEIVDTLILGGFDRGIDYSVLYPFLVTSGISGIIFIGAAGKRIMKEFKKFGAGKIVFYIAYDYSQIIEIAHEITKKGKICLLSPAAASYDMFKNFEERGNIFKKNVRELDPSQNATLFGN